MARPKRDSRFDILYKFYQGYKAEIQSIEQLQDNIKILEYFLFESELGKFSEKYPEVDMTEFQTFLVDAGAFKTIGSKTSGNGKTTRLHTIEKAQSVGVAETDVPRYQELINNVFLITKELNKLCTTGRVSFAIPKLKTKDETGHGEKETATG